MLAILRTNITCNLRLGTTNANANLRALCPADGLLSAMYHVLEWNGMFAFR